MGMTSWERMVLALVAIAVIAAVAVLVGKQASRLRNLARITAVITFGLIVLGAYVRLSDAGLGCPDWPGCFGQFTPSLAAESIEHAHAQAPHGPVSAHKAWKEMVHRYLAMLVGCLIVAMAICATRQKDDLKRRTPSRPVLAWATVVVVIVQAVLGAWTVTWLLKPAIVTLHLLGGMATLALLVWYAQTQRPGPAGNSQLRRLRPMARLALATLLIQITLGGWVSTNYAAAVCGELPLCQGQILPPMDFPNGFHVVRELGKTAQGSNLALPALTAIHMAHRIFAIAVLLVFVLLIVRAARVAGGRRYALALSLALAAQIALGLKLVWAMAASHLDLSIHLPLAAGHNAVAALLWTLTLLINYESQAAQRALNR
ncbi:MAG TPA: COX15/CtaA family protein [Burkholderiaceae bacterium]|nr:COX15/CtaA family protein [Burkholderiaceae bacterium]